MPCSSRAALPGRSPSSGASPRMPSSDTRPTMCQPAGCMAQPSIVSLLLLRTSASRRTRSMSWWMRSADAGTRRQPGHRPSVPARARSAGRCPPRGSARPRPRLRAAMDRTADPAAGGPRAVPRRHAGPSGPLWGHRHDGRQPPRRPRQRILGPADSRAPQRRTGPRPHPGRAGCPHRVPGRRLRHL